MDAIYIWKKILLQWVNKCNLLEHSFYTIDQIEIESFFIEFKKTVKDDICKYKDVTSFLKEQYPNFEPHYDEENTQINSSDYVYIYSLFLHFSCVKNPNEYFQNVCKQLKETEQQSIAEFFKNILEDNFLTKESLRHTIASISLSTPPSMRVMYSDSPLKTPRKTGISPQTPKSCMLQEKNKKMKSLEAQLETVMYEKSVLETDLKNCQEDIFKLKQDLKKSNQVIKDLQNEIIKNNDIDSEVQQAGENQLIQRLAKQISQKEKEISEKSDLIDGLTEQKDSITGKLKSAEKRIKELEINIQELEKKVDELSFELEQRDHTIQSLSDAKSELENYISEVRTSSAYSRPDLNASGEYLDLSRTTNSSGSITSPENLGSVIDIKLQEKEVENANLRSEITTMRINNVKLAKHINDLTLQYSKTFEIDEENLTTNNNENEDPQNCLIVFSNYLNKFVMRYEDNSVELNKLKDLTQSLSDKNEVLSNKNIQNENEITDLRKENSNLSLKNKNLNVSKNKLDSEIIELKTHIETCSKELQIENQRALNLQDELQKITKKKIEEHNDFNKQISELMTSLSNEKDKFSELKADFENKLKTIEKHENDIHSYELNKKQLQTQIEQLNLQYEKEKSQLIHDSSEKLEKTCKTYENKLKQIDFEKQMYIDNILALKTNIKDTQELLLNTMYDICQHLQENLNKNQKLASIKNMPDFLLESTDKVRDGELNHLEKDSNDSIGESDNSTKYFTDVIELLQNRLQDIKKISQNKDNASREYNNEFNIEVAKGLHTSLVEIKNLFGQLIKSNKNLLIQSIDLKKSKQILNEELKSLKEKMSDLESKLSNQTDSVKILENEIALAQKLTEDKKKYCQTLEEKNKESELILGSLSEKITHLQSQIIALEKTQSNLEDNVRKHCEEQQTLKADLEKKLEEKILLQNCASLLQEKNKEAELTIENLNKEILELQSKIHLLESNQIKENDKAQMEKMKNAENVEKLKKLELQLETILNVRCQELESKVINLQQLQTELLSTKSELTEKVEEMTRKLEESSKEMKNLKVQYETKVLENTDLIKVNDTIKLQLESKVINLQQLQSELLSTKSELTDKVEEMTRKLEENSKEMKNLKVQYETKVLENTDLIKENDTIKLQLEAKVINLQQLQTELLSTKAELTEKVAEMTKKMDENSEEMDNLKVQYETKVLENTDLMKENELQLDEINKQKLELTEKVEEMKKKLEINFEEMKNLKLQCENKVLENTNLIKENNKIKLQLDEINKQKLELTEKVEEMKKNLDENSEEMKNLKVQYNTKVLENIDLIKEIDIKNLQVDEINVQKSELTEKVEEMKKKLEENFEEMKNLKLQCETKVLENTDLIKENDTIKLQLDEINKQKSQLLNQCQTYELESIKLNEIIKEAETEMSRLKCQKTRLLNDIETLKETNKAAIEKLSEIESDQKENISRLIKEIESIRKEKDALAENNSNIIKRFEEKVNMLTSLEANHSVILKKLESTEQQLLTNQNLLNIEQLKNQDIDKELIKLQTENTKLKETAKTNMNRMEKQALKLGETQARCQKLKKEAELAQNCLDKIKSTSDSMQRENNKLTLELSSLKEKLTKCEKTIEQLEMKLQKSEKDYEALQKERNQIETSENNLKSTKELLEKNKLVIEEKLRKLTKTLSDSNVAINRLEQDKVQLSLEVGRLNSQLQEGKRLLTEKQNEITILTKEIAELKNANTKQMELIEKLQVEANNIREENSRLNDVLSKVSLRLKISEENHEKTRSEFENLQKEINANKNERDAMEKSHEKTIKRLQGVEVVVEEQKATESEYSKKINSLEAEIAKITAEYKALEEKRKHDKTINDQLTLDISILQAKLHKSRSICEENEIKWNEEKLKLLEEVKESEERIKETRIELEGKLEKMKLKMKTLYNDEVTKIKSKQEREMAVTKSELDALKAKNNDFKEHVKKLSDQIFRLNENILEHQKENTFLKTKLKDFENKPRHLNRIMPSNGSHSSAQVLSSNLHMEDEEGEVFNNTYLSDLKNGRMSELFSKDISPQELQYRNSLLPPHLKSTYLAQFDHQMGEDEIRDTPSLDDSMSTLLNAGQRKKVSGATSYKRPGPPTPSKNAGRLSFGGMGELNREILKECSDVGNLPSTSKTPAKFRLFSSKLSFAHKDELKNCVTNFKQKHKIIGAIQCSSTPRKSKAHHDQRRLLDQMMSTASPDPENSPDFLVKQEENLPSSLKRLELNRRMTQKWRTPKSTYTTDSGTSDVNSPLVKGTGCKRSKRFKDRRSSIYLRGCMFAKNCRTPTVGTREGFKKKSKIQRNANFNKHRNAFVNQFIVQQPIILPDRTFSNDNNNFCIEEISANNTIENMQMTAQISNASDELNSDKSLKHFKQLLAIKESRAPFEISEINGPSYSNVNGSLNVHCRTIYGASVILNRKIPNVSTTHVRKSSIYVKAKDGQDIILVTNQTITLMDLARIWTQMNMSSKMFISLCFIALCGAIYFPFSRSYNGF